MKPFKQFESLNIGESIGLEEGIDALHWNEHGLIAAITQQYDTRAVLMMAWMNELSLRETLKTGQVCYWSRSRQCLWRKGETSGQTQRLHQLYFDCDGDALLVQVDQTGPACHTGRPGCFYYKLDGDRLVVNTAPMIDPKNLYGSG